MPFNNGDEVIAIGASEGWGQVDRGDRGVIRNAGRDSYGERYYRVDFPQYTGWLARDEDLQPALPKRSERRTAKKLIPETNREKTAVKMIERVTTGPGKFTAVKIESEGRLDRTNNCTAGCSRRVENRPHLGCKYFSDTKVANDYILRYLAKYGLAKRCKQGENAFSYLYKPKSPLMFSKVYTDSETEWTTTLLLKEASDVLYTPILVDAFNALAKANGNGIDVDHSGMHTAFLQGKNGIYPDPLGNTATQNKMFKNFAKSMRPLLPALYLLGANRIESGQGITRSISPRQPMVSATDKYSAVAYRYGALEFRLFDTCYDKRNQVLDNIVVMSQAVNKYWHKKYHRPAITINKPVYFGSHDCTDNTKNKLKDLYLVKEHVIFLNQGLRCIKPPYLTVKEIKQARNFNLTVRDVKEAVHDVTEKVKTEYDRHVKKTKLSQIHQAAREFSALTSTLLYMNIDSFDLETDVSKLWAKADKIAKQKYRPEPIEMFVYKARFGMAYLLGDK